MVTKKQLTQSKIIEIAWRQFTRQGYEHTSTRVICDQAGIAHGTLFSHFANKEKLLIALMQTKLEEQITNALSQSQYQQPKLKLREVAASSYEFLSAHKELALPFVSALVSDATALTYHFNSIGQPLAAQAPHYSEQRIEAMLDCYFMTLVKGLHSSTEPHAWLRTLSAKINEL